MQEIKIEDKLYPNELRKIKSPPNKIYIKGNLELLKNVSIAIVGSRECTSYGFRQAYEFSKELSKNNICIISGLAEGIDTAAHLGAMHQIGKTIAVIGSGFNYIYPEENKILLESIIKNDGLVITEYSLNEEPKPTNFPKRNRIMSGLSKGILIVEAKNRSGTLITAKFANEQNKKVFCIPNNIDSKNSIGTNNLINQGAKLVINVNDILQEIIEEETNEEYKCIYSILNSYPMNINEIAKKANLSIAETNQIITMLEIEGLIEKLPNNEFIKR